MNLPIPATWLQARFSRDERGASMVEYAMLVALIAVVAIFAVMTFGEGVSTRFSDVNESVAAS